MKDDREYPLPTHRPSVRCANRKYCTNTVRIVGEFCRGCAWEQEQERRRLIARRNPRARAEAGNYREHHHEVRS